MRPLQRALQFLILGVLVSSACGKKQGAPTSGTAGDVQAIEGLVTATRDGQEPRSLSLADLVYVNDTIKTSIGSSIRIRLNHNQADWSMKAGSEKRITQGLAWRATSKGAGSFNHADEVSTGAAGRHAGKQAAAHQSELSKDQGAGTLKAARESEQEAPSDSPPRAEPITEANAPGAASKRESRNAKTSRGGSVGGRSRTRSGAGAGAADVGDRKLEKAQQEPLGVNRKKRSNDLSRSLDIEAESEDTEVRPPVADEAWINKIAQHCHSEHGGSGTLSYRLVISAGSLKSFTTPDAPASLSALSKCMRAKIKSTDLREKKSLSGAISF